MKKFSEIAVNNFKEGFNCSQSVFLAFAEEFGIDKQTALKLSSSFGGGMGRLREVCGAVTAMFAIVGLKHGYTSPTDDAVKTRHYELIQELAEKFKSEHGSIICRDLLNLSDGADSPVPSKRTEKYYSERPCELFVQKAAEIIEAKLLN